MIESRETTSGRPACSIRSPEPVDFNSIAELARQLGYECTAEQVRVRLSEIRDANECAVYVAELADGQIAGWIGVYLFRSVEMEKIAQISGLVVAEEHRSRGIGKILLHAAERWARKRGSRGISVHSNVVRERAHLFYEKNGYETYKTQKLFCKSF